MRRRCPAYRFFSESPARGFRSQRSIVTLPVDEERRRAIEAPLLKSAQTRALYLPSSSACRSVREADLAPQQAPDKRLVFEQEILLRIAHLFRTARSVRLTVPNIILHDTNPLASTATPQRDQRDDIAQNRVSRTVLCQSFFCAGRAGRCFATLLRQSLKAPRPRSTAP